MAATFDDANTTEAGSARDHDKCLRTDKQAKKNLQMLQNHIKPKTNHQVPETHFDAGSKDKPATAEEISPGNLHG